MGVSDVRFNLNHSSVAQTVRVVIRLSNFATFPLLYPMMLMLMLSFTHMCIADVCDGPLRARCFALHVRVASLISLVFSVMTTGQHRKEIRLLCFLASAVFSGVPNEVCRNQRAGHLSMLSRSVQQNVS